MTKASEVIANSLVEIATQLHDLNEANADRDYEERRAKEYGYDAASSLYEIRNMFPKLIEAANQSAAAAAELATGQQEALRVLKARECVVGTITLHAGMITSSTIEPNLTGTFTVAKS